jgi:CRP-like cAMP-binding protein
MPGETVIRKGDKEDSLFFILVGQVEVGLDSGPVVLERGEYFGELGILYKKPRMVTVTAKSSCQFLVLDAEDFNLLLAQHPDLHEEVMGVAAQRIEGEGVAGEKV